MSIVRKMMIVSPFLGLISIPVTIAAISLASIEAPKPVVVAKPFDPKDKTVMVPGDGDPFWQHLELQFSCGGNGWIVKYKDQQYVGLKSGSYIRLATPVTACGV